MVTSSIGVVLCRLAAVLLFVRAFAGVAGSIQLFAESHTPVWANLAIASLISLAPAVLGAGIWIYAERISRLPSGISEAERLEAIQPTGLVMAGTLLIGLYAVVFGIVNGFAVEAGFWSAEIHIRNSGIEMHADTAQRIAKRIPYVAQTLLGILLILGRQSIARLMLKARYAGTGA